MELSVIRNPELVIALDIGSTYSGYAWQSRGEFETNKNEIHFNTDWSTGALQLHKTKTCLLIQKKPDRESIFRQSNKGDGHDTEFVLDPGSIEKVRFGHDAEKTFTKLAKKTSELYGRYYFFSRFKLLLYKEGFHDKQHIEDQLDQPFLLLDVMACFIKALKDHCLNKLESHGVNVNHKKTLYVLTVPAIWSEQAKKFMRKAANQAGIENKNILLALEPEAAAISCFHLPKENIQAMSKLGDKGQKFLFADLGGGTADLLAVQVEDNGSLKELCEPNGKLIGGQNINDAFLQECYDSFEGEQWNKIFSNTTPIEMIKMEADFEQTKVTMGNEDEMLDLKLPDAVKEGLVNKSIRLKSDSCVQFEDSEFRFDPEIVRNRLFKTICQEVYKNTVKRVLDKPEAHGISTVILVGGFAQSQILKTYMQEMITKDFPSIKVVVPFSPFKAILMGAVLYGHDPMIFNSRICRETYGVRTNVKFNDTIHDVSKRWKKKATGKEYCKDIFDIHVKKGQSIRLSEEHSKCDYFPLNEDQTVASFPVFASSSENPKYTTDESCRKIGTIKVDMPDLTGGVKREIEVSMIYGGTELSVKAKDKTTGVDFVAEININDRSDDIVYSRT